MDNNIQHEIVLYQIDDTNVYINVVYMNETFWVTQKSMSELFEVTPQSITRHLQNIYNDDELDKNSTCTKIEQVRREGTREVKRQVDFYNLDAIIAVGYRVNSKKATRFRQWATKTLKEYITKGFVLNDDMLKNGRPFGKDYFDELLERIREIRASERRAYQKITDVFQQCSYDYDSDSEITKNFYAFVQNKLHYAVTGQTAAEIIYERADANKPTMGLTTWKDAPDGKIYKRDIGFAKNYLNEKEIARLNRLVTMFIDYAELMAEDEVLMSMKDWLEQTNVFLKNNRRNVLKGTQKPNYFHFNLLKLFANQENVRIVTTNQDEMFEAAAKEMGYDKIKIYSAPALPYGNDFTGIVHLHGRVSEPKNIIVTDVDFGRAYMLNGYATSFVADMINSYVVLFIGYSYGDVVMRYLTSSIPKDMMKNAFILMENKPDAMLLVKRTNLKIITFEPKKFDEECDAIRKIGDFANRKLLDWKDCIFKLSEEAPPVDKETQDEMENIKEKDDVYEFIFVLCAYTPNLYYLNKKWVEDNIFPYLEFGDKGYNIAAWKGFLNHVRSYNAEIGSVILPMLKDNIGIIDKLSKNEKRAFINAYVLLVVYLEEKPIENYISVLIKNCDADERMFFAYYIRNILEKQESSEREKLWNNWLKEYWRLRNKKVPVELCSEELSEMVYWIPLLENNFEECVDLLLEKDDLEGLTYSDIFDKLCGSNVVDSFPMKASELVCYLLKHTRTQVKRNSVDKVIEILKQKKVSEEIMERISIEANKMTY